MTGGAGYIGSHTAKLLSEAGCEPVVYDNLSTGHRAACRWGPLIEADLGDRTRLSAALRQYRFEAVLHFAALAYVGDSVVRPQDYFRNNVGESLTLLECMLEHDVRTIVFSSTCATYGDPVRLPMDESHPQRPVNPYGESKLFVERVLHWYSGSHALRWFALRYFNAAGADPGAVLGEMHEPEPHLIPRVLRAASGRGEKVTIFGTDYPTSDGTAVRDYIHVTDLACAHLLALRHLEQGGESMACNLGTGRGYSVREVIAEVERRIGLSVPVREEVRRAGDPAALIADPKLANRVLGWRPEYSDLTTIIDTAWRFEQKRDGS